MKKIEAAISTAISRDVKIGDVYLNLNGRIKADSVEIFHKEKLLGKADNLLIETEFKYLKYPFIGITKISIVEPYVNFIKNDKSFILPWKINAGKENGGKENGGKPLFSGPLKIKEAEILYTDETDINLSARLSKTNGEINFSNNGINIDFNAMGLLKISEEDYSFNEIQATIGKSERGWEIDVPLITGMGLTGFSDLNIQNTPLGTEVFGKLDISGNPELDRFHFIPDSIFKAKGISLKSEFSFKNNAVKTETEGIIEGIGNNAFYSEKIIFDISTDNDTIFVNSLNMQMEEGIIHASGKLGLYGELPFDIKLDTDNKKVRYTPPQAWKTGQLSISCKSAVSGSIKNRKFRKSSLKASIIPGKSISGFSLNASAANRAVRFNIKYNEGNAGGELTFSDTAVKGSFQAKNIKTDEFSELFLNEKIVGTLDFDGKFGPVPSEKPLYFIRLSKGKIEYKGISSDISGKLHNTPGGIIIDTALINAVIPHTFLSEIDTGFTNDTASGRITVDAGFGGHINSLKGRGTLFSTGIGYRGFYADSLNVPLSYSEKTVILNPLTIYNGDNCLKGPVSVSLKDSALYARLCDNKKNCVKINVSASAFDKYELSAIALINDASAAEPYLEDSYSIGGSAECSLSIVADREKLKEADIRGYIKSKDLSFLKSGKGLRNFDSYISLKDRFIIIDSAVVNAGGQSFRISGDIKRGKSDSVYFNLNSEGPGSASVSGGIASGKADLRMYISGNIIQAAAYFLPEGWKTSGDLHAKVDINGDFDSLIYDGTIKASSVNISPPDSLFLINKGFANMKIKSGTLFVDSAGFYSKNGKTLIKGNVQRAGEVDLAINARGMDLKKPDIFKTTDVNCSLLVGGNKEKINIKGKAGFKKLRFIKNFDLKSIVPLSENVTKIPDEKSEFLENIYVEIRIDPSSKIEIENNITDITIKPSVTLQGPFYSIMPAGRITVADGKAVFLDREFKIISGTADFSSAKEINPAVQAEAVTSIDDFNGIEPVTYDIYLNLSGTLKDPVVNFRSEPYLDKTNILALLTIGTTRERIAYSGDVIKERAGRITTGQISSYLSEKVSRSTGLDRINIKGNIFNTGGGNGPVLEAVKKINPKTEITYSSNIGNFSRNKIIINYMISNRISLEGETDQSGNNGLDLKYRVEFE